MFWTLKQATVNFNCQFIFNKSIEVNLIAYKSYTDTNIIQLSKLLINENK